MAIIGLDVGGTKILGVLFDDNGEIVDQEKVPSKGEEGHKVFIDQVHFVVDSLIEKSSVEIHGIGVGVPGIVDTDGEIVFSPNLPFEGYRFKKEFQERYNVPVVIGNDVNLGTYGEYCELKLEHANVIGLFPGTGLGGGIIIDGKLYIGQGFAGEIGHITVEKDGVKCGCGNHGCLESYASKKGILSYARKQIRKGRKTLLKEDVKMGVVKSTRLKKVCDEKDKVALEAMEQFYDYLAMGCGIIMNIFNPDIILIGGGIIEVFNDVLLKKVTKRAKKYAMPGVYEKSEIRKSQLGDHAVAYGGYHLMKSKL